MINERSKLDWDWRCIGASGAVERYKCRHLGLDKIKEVLVHVGIGFLIGFATAAVLLPPLMEVVTNGNY